MDHALPVRFNRFSQLLHWLLFVLIVAQFAIVYRAETFPDKSPEMISLVSFHKSLGITILGIGLLFVLWRLLKPRPPYLTTVKAWENRLAKFTHVCLFLIVLLMPVTGYLMSMLGGRTINWFGFYTFKRPFFLPENKAFSDIIFECHTVLSYILIGLVSLHVLGALTHLLIYKDSVFKRMLPFK